VTPRATVRLQLHQGYTLHDAREQVPYFASLGISHYYLSPVSRARPGSMHGYDVVDPTLVSPELGGEDALRALATALREQGMGMVLDIVPNHMATHPDNAWWWDVLEHGPASRYAEWLDIDWRSPDPQLRGKVLAPFLGEPYGDSLTGGQIQLVFDEAHNTFRIDVAGTPYPVAPDSLGALGLERSQALKRYETGTQDGRQRLHELLERQHYRLAWWRCTADIINWRRFFEVSELIGVRMENEAAFDAVHALPLRLYAEGLIDGLRIDHVDGLAQPIAYCHKLREAMRSQAGRRPEGLRDAEPWLVVEKILAGDEALDERWDVDGTSGYDFMDQAGAVLHDPAGEAPLTAHWERVAQDARSPDLYLREARRLMLRRHFVAERKGLLRALSGLAQSHPRTRDWTSDAIGRVLDEFLVAFPIYRTYADASGRSVGDAQRMAGVMQTVRDSLGRGQATEVALLDLLDGWLGGDPVAAAPDTGISSSRLQQEAIRRFQQLTPPLAAKSLEDTVFYRYGRLLSRNEVGSDPMVFALSADAFHQRNLWRVHRAPRSLLATATHDHKRGEDVRARLAVLSEMPQEWEQVSTRWLQWPGRHDASMPATTLAERYMLFQTLVGAWPLDLRADDSAEVRAYLDRVVQWQAKALREAKLTTSWFEPDEAHEQASADFVRSLAPGAPNHDLLKDIERVALRIAPAGAVNSLAQTVLRMASPGIPDLYQGTEFWDFSLVDPDNRRPVDFAARHAALDAVDGDADMADLLADWKDGRIKQAVLARALRLRRRVAGVFEQGDYVALPVLGPKSANVLAFIRSREERMALVVVPRLCRMGIAVGAAPGRPEIDADFWGDTGIVLPRRYLGVRLHDALTGAAWAARETGMLRVAHVLGGLPVAMLSVDQG
jgi:(1->4)-alpha-D-glucan 1-alpha-D-glucosylmutase